MNRPCLTTTFGNPSNLDLIYLGWSSSRSPELSGDDTGTHIGVRISVGILSYQTITVIIVVPIVSVYYEKNEHT